MATTHWTGDALAVAQLTTVTVGGTLAGETFTISVNGVAIASHTDADTVIATTVAALVSAWNSSTHAYATGITAADASPDVTLTGDTAGVPFVVTLNTPGGAATFAQVETTSATGPNHWDNAENWSGVVPVATDDVIIAEGPNICWGLDQSAVDLNSLVIRQTYTGKIGLRRDALATSSDGETVDTTANEYRSTYLDIESDSVSIGTHDGPGRPNGSQRIKLDLGVHATLVEVFNTARVQSETGLPAVRLLFNQATSDLYVRYAPGGVGIGVDAPGETASLDKIVISDTSTDTRFHMGDGVTWVTYEQTGGQNIARGAAGVTSINVLGGELRTEGTYAVTTMTVAKAGTVYPNSVGTITTLEHNIGGEVDFGESRQARTITNYQLEVGAPLPENLDPSIITLSGGIVPVVLT